MSAIWGTLFLVFWKKKESLVLRQWGEDFSDHQRGGLGKLGLTLTRNCHNLTRIFTPGTKDTDILPDPSSPSAVATNYSNKPPSEGWRRFRVSLSTCVTLLLLLVSLWILMFLYEWEDDISAHNLSHMVWGYNVLTHLPILFRTLFPIVFGPLYNIVVDGCTHFEFHLNPAKAETSAIIKKFSFQIVVTFFPFFNLCFLKQDMVLLKYSLMFSLTVNAGMRMRQAP